MNSFNLKQVFAILLILILLFNIGGYNLVFKYIEQKATQRLEKKIDAHQYSEAELIEFKIPLQMPYYNDIKYESCYGEIEVNGEHYRYVKRKVSNNTLYVLCLPHIQKNNIIALKSNLIKSLNDKQDNNVPQQQTQQSCIKLMLSEFLSDDLVNDFNLRFIKSKKIYSIKSFLSPQFKPGALAQPPEFIS